jgi:hypothetical protein
MSMGYTHYWNRDKPEIPLHKWQKALEQIRPLIERGESSVGLSDVELSDDLIFFNGQHETFVMPRVARESCEATRDLGTMWAFCKTAMKAYDPVVVACLLILDHVLKGDSVGFSWSSDGNWPKDHAGGIELSGLDFNTLTGPRK